MTDLDFRVPALSRASIRSLAQQVRQHMPERTARFDIVRFLDVALSTADDTFDLVVTNDERVLAGAHALTEPDENTIYVRESMYIGATAGVGRDRMTLAHECGHLVMHRDVDVLFARTTERLKPFVSAEWQAKAFAGELLIDWRLLTGRESPTEVARRFGVSTQAATFHITLKRRELNIA